MRTLNISKGIRLFCLLLPGGGVETKQRQFLLFGHEEEALWARVSNNWVWKRTEEWPRLSLTFCLPRNEKKNNLAVADVGWRRRWFEAPTRPFRSGCPRLIHHHAGIHQPPPPPLLPDIDSEPQLWITTSWDPINAEELRTGWLVAGETLRSDGHRREMMGTGKGPTHLPHCYHYCNYNNADDDC